MGWTRGGFWGARTVLLVSLAGLLILSAQSSFLSWNGHTASGILSTGPTETLSCEEVIKLVRWGAKRHGSARVDLHSASLGEKAIESYLEKVDPNRVLLLESEVKALKQKGIQSWEKLVSSSRCGDFDEWHAKHVSKARQRLIDFAKSASWSASFLQRTAVQRKPLQAPFKPDSGFAKSPMELQRRQYRFAESLIFSTSSEVLETYANHRQRFVLEKLDSTLFGNSVSSKELLAKAILNAMDPYSTYFSRSEFEDFYQELSGEAKGIGIRVQKGMSGLIVEEVVPGSPSDRAGIRAGMRILSIGQKILDGLSFSEIASLLRGEEDDSVELELEFNKGVKRITLKREAFEIEDNKVKASVRSLPQASVGVVVVPSFYGQGEIGAGTQRSSSEDLRKALENILQDKAKQGKAKPKGLVLDLRGNPGGYLEEAVSMAGAFLGSQTVVGVVENSQTRVLRDESSSSALYSGPLVVLVDEGTASAGEILAAALKDYQRAILVGSPTTFGKGSVQKLFQLDDPFLQVGLENPGVMKLTTSLFYSPLGHSPANGGISTHIALKENAGDSNGSSTGMEVAEIPPLVDEPTLEQLKVEKPRFQQLLTDLNNLREIRSKETSSFPENAGKKEDRGENPSDDVSGDSLLSEAVQIAADLAWIQTELASAPLEKSSTAQH